VTEALAADRHAAAGGRDVAVALRDALQAWRSLGWRQWVAALATGLVVGLGQTLVELATVAGDEPDASPWALLVFAAVKLMPMYLAAAALLLPGLAVLERRERGTPAFASHAALIVLVAIVAGALGHFTHPLGMRALLALGMSHPFSALEFTWSSALLFSLLRSMSLLIVLSLATLVYVYLSNSRRTARRLAAAQVRHSEAERRLLAEQLTGTQALVEPALLFDTLRLVEELFERNAEAAQWRNTLATYAYPVCGDLPVAQVNVAHVTEILEPIWKTKTETASRLRGRVESVLDWATVRGYRSGENPARWRGHLAKLLPKRSAVQKVKHHGAVPYEEVGAFVRKVRKSSGIAPAALEFVILTGVRTGEALRAKWNEVSLDRKEPTWTIPAERMKAKREHRVPLSPRAVEILRSMAPLRDKAEYLFPSPMKTGKPLSDMTLLMIVRRLQGAGLTTHGFRSTFRDWASERTNYPREVAEAALAHVVADKTEAAYRRGDLFEKRRRMMADWEKLCGTVGNRGANVVKLRA
jgi:integrase